MVHLKSTRTVIVLLVSLIALEEFIALAQRDIAVYRDNNAIHKSDEELHVKTGTVGANSKKWLRGRMMVAEAVKEVRSAANTGNAKTCSSESLCSSNTEETSSSTVTNLKIKGNKGSVTKGKPQVIEASSNNVRLGSSGGSELSVLSISHDLNQTTQRQNLLEATAEMFKMLNKDYQFRARRHPPVHN